MKLSSNIAPEYDSSKSYEKGDKVLYNGNLYRLGEPMTGDFVEDNAEKIYLTDLLGSPNLAPVLLWTNPSPTSNFEAQTVELDLSEYDSILIESAWFKDAPTVNISKALIVKNNEYQAIGTFSNNGSSTRGCLASNSGVQIGNAYMAESKRNDTSIPLKIYGVKKYVVATNSNLGGGFKNESIDYIWDSANNLRLKNAKNYNIIVVYSYYAPNNSYNFLLIIKTGTEYSAYNYGTMTSIRNCQITIDGNDIVYSDNGMINNLWTISDAKH